MMMNATTAVPSSGVGGLFTGFSRLCKGLATVLAVGYAFGQIFPSTVDYLALVPGKTIPFAWNVLTAGYFEQSLSGLIVSILGLLFGGRLLEPVWGSREFTKFIIVVNLLTCLCTFVFTILLYYISGTENYLYMPLSGFHGVLSGFLVGMKQIMPEQEQGFLKLRVKWLPSIFILFSVIVGLLVGDFMSFFPFILFGTYCSWIYLRYFQRRTEANLKGDPSYEFSFATFFPEFLRPVVNPVASLCEKLFCGKAQNTLEEGQGIILGGLPLPGSDLTEATRRRERGARALEERLNASAKSGDVDVKDHGSKPNSGFPPEKGNVLGAEDNV